LEEGVRLQERRSRAKQLREEASMRTKLQKEREKAHVEWDMHVWKDRRLVETQTVIEVEDEDEGNDGEWDEDEQVSIHHHCVPRLSYPHVLPVHADCPMQSPWGLYAAAGGRNSGGVCCATLQNTAGTS
jgi:hypothetical protein